MVVEYRNVPALLTELVMFELFTVVQVFLVAILLPQVFS